MLKYDPVTFDEKFDAHILKYVFTRTKVRHMALLHMHTGGRPRAQGVLCLMVFVGGTAAPKLGEYHHS